MEDIDEFIKEMKLQDAINYINYTNDRVGYITSFNKGDYGMIPGADFYKWLREKKLNELLK